MYAVLCSYILNQRQACCSVSQRQPFRKPIHVISVRGYIRTIPKFSVQRPEGLVKIRASQTLQQVKSLPEMEKTQEIWFQSLGRKIPWRRAQPPPVFLPGESHEQWSLVGYGPWTQLKRLSMYPCLWVADSVGLGWGLRICIPDKFPGDAAAAGLEPHCENHCLRGMGRWLVTLGAENGLKSTL